MKTKKNMKCLLGMVFMIMSALNVSAVSVTYSVNSNSSWNTSPSNGPVMTSINRYSNSYFNFNVDGGKSVNAVRICGGQYYPLTIQIDNGDFKYHVNSVKISCYCLGNYKIDGHFSVEPVSGSSKSTDFTEDFTRSWDKSNYYDVQLKDLNGIKNINVYENNANTTIGGAYYAYVYIRSITIDYDLPSITKISNAPSEMVIGDGANIFSTKNLGAFNIVYTTDPNPSAAFTAETVNGVTHVTANKVGTATVTGTIEGYTGTNNSASHTITVSMPTADDLLVGNTVSVRTNNGTRLFGTTDTNWGTAWRHEQVPLTMQVYSGVDATAVSGSLTNRIVKGVNNSKETEKWSIYTPKNTNSYVKLSLPRGYRIMGYKMSVTRKTSSGNEVTESANIIRYLDSFSSSSDYKEFGRDTWLTANGGIEESFSGVHNILCLKFSGSNTAAYNVIDTLAITYVVDESFTESFPSEDGKSFVETDVVDFGTFTGTTPQYTQSNVTDDQLVRVYKSGDTEDKIDSKSGRGSNVSYFDGCYAVSANGDYIVEAPQGYRIIGANVTYKMAPTGSITNMIKADEDNTYCPISPYEMNHTDESGANLFDSKYYKYGTYPKYSGSETKWCCDWIDGKTYLIFDATVPCRIDNYTLIDALDTYHKVLTQYGPYPWRHWLTWDIYGGNFASFAEAQKAAEDKGNTLYWTKIGKFTDDAPGSTNETYSAATGTAATSSKKYEVDETKVGAYRFYRVEVTSVDDPTDGDAVDTNKKQQMAEMQINFLGNGHNFTITLPDGTTMELSNEEGGTSEYTTAILAPDGTTNLNNDAIKVNIAGLPSDMTSYALFKVDLTLMPLDPHIQKVNVIATGLTSDSKIVENNLRRSAYDFEFKDVNIVVPKGSSDYKLSVTDAYNEQGIDTGKSNYFLIGSRYSNGLPTLKSGARQTISSNILDTETFGDKPELVVVKSTGDDGYVLTDNDYASIEESAKWGDDKDLTETATPYYMYVADYPLYNISSTPHIAYRFYKVNAKVMEPDVKAFVDALPIQEVARETTLNSNQFEMTRYVGIKAGVGCNIYGYTGPCYISNGNGSYLSSAPVNTGDQKVGKLQIVTENPTLWYLEKNGIYYRLYYVSDDGKKNYLGIWTGSNGELQIYSDNIPDAYVNWEVNELGQMYVHLGNQYCTLSIGNNDKNWWFSSTPSTLPYTENTQTGEKTSRNNEYAQLQATTFTSADGNISSSYIIDAIKQKLTNSNYEFKVAGGTTDAERYSGVLYLDLSGLSNVAETKIGGVSDWVNFQNKAANNCMFFMSSEGSGNLTKNVVTKIGTTDVFNVDKDITIEDEAPFYTPYDIIVVGDNSKVSYSRTHYTNWNTAFLPFPVKNNENGIKYYYLYASNSQHMVFKPYADKEEIPANTPVLFYSEDDISMDFQNGSVDSDENLELTKSISAKGYNNTKKTADLSSTVNWQFIGTRFNKYIYSPTNTNCPITPEMEQSNNVYYFSANNVHTINPNGRVMFPPFRAYMKHVSGSQAKSLSFIILDEEVGATDITDIIDGEENAGDGKMYDLCGRRIMKPVKGQIYIVDGQKKIY